MIANFCRFSYEILMEFSGDFFYFVDFGTFWSLFLWDFFFDFIFISLDFSEMWSNFSDYWGFSYFLSEIPLIKNQDHCQLCMHSNARLIKA